LKEGVYMTVAAITYQN